MIGEELGIEIELCGYKAKISHIYTRTALPPLYPEDEFLAVIEFDEPHPQAIISTAIAIPVREYPRDKLLKIIKEEGDKQFARTLTETRKKREENARQKQRREELETMAKRAEEVLKGE